MKRLDHAELHEQLHDALLCEVDRIPAAADAERLAEILVSRLSRFEVFDPETRADLPELGLAMLDQAVPKDTIFARWLLAQSGRREGWIGDLARAAKNDPSFPRDADVDAARAWLDRRHASGDDYAALEDAELDWLAL